MSVARGHGHLHTHTHETRQFWIWFCVILASDLTGHTGFTEACDENYETTALGGAQAWVGASQARERGTSHDGPQQIRSEETTPVFFVRG